MLVAAMTVVGLTPLRDLVGHVVSVGTEEEMAWVYACRIVAAMQHQHPRRNFSAMYLVREAMRTTHTVVEPKRTISLDVLGPGPIPAAARLLNLAPKSIHDYPRCKSADFTM
jgi:hypothetical protein